MQTRTQSIRRNHRGPNQRARPGAAPADAGRRGWRQAYCRTRDLPRLLPLWPTEIEDESETGRRHIIAKLRRALREERRRGVAGHWAYDLARHAGLYNAYRQELAALRAAQQKVVGST